MFCLRFSQVFLSAGLHSWVIHNHEASHNFMNDSPHEDLIAAIVQELKHGNPMFQKLMELGNTTQRNLAVRIDCRSHKHELAIIRTTTFNTNSRSTLFIRKVADTGHFQQIPPWHRSYEALSFPVFFTQGEAGWDYLRAKHSRLSLLHYVRARILMPEKILARSQSGRCIWVNRFQLLARLMQLYILENFSRYIDMRLDFLKRSQHLFHTFGQESMFGEDVAEMLPNDDGHHNSMLSADPDAEYHGLPDFDEDHQHHVARDFDADVEETAARNESAALDDIHNDVDTEKRVILPASFLWGNRHKKMRAANALHLVSRLGRPTLFITATTNPKWSEIVNELLEGQLACDRPDVTARVFASKLAVLLSCLRAGEFLPSHNKLVYEVYVTEFQKRGLPHAHIVLKLHDMPTSVQGTREWVDSFITACMPDPDADPEHYQAVQDFMVHSCDDRCVIST